MKVPHWQDSLPPQEHSPQSPTPHMVFLSMARLLGIPARYVSGLPEGDGASHAWAEIWHDGLWYGFDPTRNKLVDEGYITLCYGRDYNDCPIERGLFFGNTNQTQTTWMEVQDRFNQ